MDGKDRTMNNVDRITKLIGQRFRSFGGGQKSNWNPVVNALADNPLQFAAGVDIKDVVEVVLDQSGHDALLATIKNALTSLAIINMPIQEGTLDVATNEDLLKIMAESFKAAIAEAEPKEGE